MKKIPLTRGFEALVDDEDFEMLNKWKWSIGAIRCTAMRRAMSHPAVKEAGKETTIYMHRIILNTPKGLQTDHIDGNPLNNQKSNLRICTHSQNQMNKGVGRNNSSGFKGVYWHKKANKWMAYVIKNKKHIHLGLFDNLKKAALAYNQAATKYHGEFARLNVIPNTELKSDGGK